jgi:hypothetical protein
MASEVSGLRNIRRLSDLGLWPRKLTMDCPKSAIHGNVIACRTRAEVCRTNNARTQPEEKAWLDLADN